jgi:hypothetical protein
MRFQIRDRDSKYTGPFNEGRRGVLAKKEGESQLRMLLRDGRACGEALTRAQRISGSVRENGHTLFYLNRPRSGASTDAQRLAEPLASTSHPPT